MSKLYTQTDRVIIVLFSLSLLTITSVVFNWTKKQIAWYILPSWDLTEKVQEGIPFSSFTFLFFKYYKHSIRYQDAYLVFLLIDQAPVRKRCLLRWDANEEKYMTHGGSVCLFCFYRLYVVLLLFYGSLVLL